MTPAFLLMLVVVVPSALILGVCIGWDRGRRHAERSLEQLLQEEPMTRETE